MAANSKQNLPILKFLTSNKVCTNSFVFIINTKLKMFHCLNKQENQAQKLFRKNWKIRQNRVISSFLKIANCAQNLNTKAIFNGPTQTPPKNCLRSKTWNYYAILCSVRRSVRSLGLLQSCFTCFSYIKRWHDFEPKLKPFAPDFEPDLEFQC